MLDAELVLEHDQVTLVGAVLHLLLEAGAEGVEGVAAGGDLLVGEDANPAQTGEDAVTLVVVGEGSLGGDGRLEVLLRGGSGAEDLLGCLLPADRGAEVVASFIAQKADVNKNLDEFGEALVTEGTTDESLGLRDVVTLTEGGGVTVRVCDEGEAGVDVVRLGGSHEVRTSNADFLTTLVEFGGVSESEQDTTAGPGELVAQRVVGALGSGKATAVREEVSDLTTGSVNLLLQQKKTRQRFVGEK